MATGYFHRVQSLSPTRFWINNVTETEARLAIAAGAVGCTQNPAYVWKMIQAEPERTFALLDTILGEQADDTQALIWLQKRLIERIADIFKPIWTESNGRHGHVTIQGDPFDEQAAAIVRQAHLNCQNRPNLSAKIPVTADGLTAIAVLAAEGLTLTLTEVMSVQQAMDACEVWEQAVRGLKVQPVAYLAHIPGIFDEHLQHQAQAQHLDIEPDLLWQAGVAVSKKIFDLMRQRATPIRFMAGGARGLHHFTELVGVDGCITINWGGTADRLLEEDPPVVQRFLQAVPTPVLDRLLRQVPDFARAYALQALQAEAYDQFGPVVRFRTAFEHAWSQALQAVADRRKQR
jgi:transaldolase